MTRKLTQELKAMPRMKGLKDLELVEIPSRARPPEEVDIVTAKDIYCGDLSGGKGHKQHCLLGLSKVNFGKGERGVNLNSNSFYRESSAEMFVNRELRKSVKAFTGDMDVDVDEFNDENMGNAQRYWIARVWNATMARLGYVVGNPEAKS